VVFISLIGENCNKQRKAHSRILYLPKEQLGFSNILFSF